ncbi:MAG: HAD-IA family hydrolase [Nitrospirae bacterium]|nr:HAD-IA family hydrolase [Nitrospirota bacterium]
MVTGFIFGLNSLILLVLGLAMLIVPSEWGAWIRRTMKEPLSRFLLAQAMVLCGLLLLLGEREAADGWFQGIVVSGHEKVKKPDRRIYQVLLDRYSITPNHAVFIDDNPVNVAVAREVGLHGLLFTTAQALRRELEGLGLL